MPKDFELNAKNKKIIEDGRQQALAAKAWDQMQAEVEDAFKVREQVPALLGRIDALEKQLARPVSLSATLKQPTKPKGDQKRPKGVDIAFDATTAELKRRFDQTDPADTLKALRPGDDFEFHRKAATQVGRTTYAGWAAELVDSDTGGMIDRLEPVSIFGAIARRGRKIPMGSNNSFTYPKRPEIADNPPSMADSFTAEGASLPHKDATLSSVTFSRMKAGVLSSFTEELNQTSIVEMRDFVERLVIDDTAIMLDSVLTDRTAALLPTIRPASPWNGAETRTSLGTDLDNVIADLTWLIAAITVNAPRDPVLIMDPARVLRLRLMREAGVFLFRDEIERGELFGIPLVVSANAPTDQVLIIDCDDFASWIAPPLVDFSNAATVVMVDDDGVAPTMVDPNAINDSGGSIHVSDAAGTTPPSQVRSAFQTYAIVMRHVAPVTWGMLRNGSTALVEAVSW
ncbi:phage major capsid protein [Primorskyibacter sp. S87]|uniref:phage major capsid protein n=1 Tax=Primorskyibacter sp. S87 TaxID=3415126 RepID=UPI003C7E2A2F